MADDETTLRRMKHDLLASASLGVFAEVSEVVLAFVKLRRLTHPDRAAYDALAGRMFEEVRDELRARLREAERLQTGGDPP